MSRTPHHHRRTRTDRRWAAVAVAVVATAVVMVGATALTAVDDIPGETGDTATDGVATSAPSTSGSANPGTRPPQPETPEPDPRRTRPTTASLLAASEPSQLRIPAIGVDTDVMDLALTDAGTLGVPPGAFPAGWYVGSPTPGELGPAIVAGHVRFDGVPGVFERLGELTAGNTVTVVRDDGSVAEFTVTRREQYAKDAFPTSTVYGDIDHAGLRLITCGGLDPDTGTYEDNVVVYAELSATRGPR